MNKPCIAARVSISVSGRVNISITRESMLYFCFCCSWFCWHVCTAYSIPGFSCKDESEAFVNLLFLVHLVHFIINVLTCTDAHHQYMYCCPESLMCSFCCDTLVCRLKTLILVHWMILWVRSWHHATAHYSWSCTQHKMPLCFMPLEVMCGTCKLLGFFSCSEREKSMKRDEAMKHEKTTNQAIAHKGILSYL